MADGLVYCVSDSGVTTVIRLDETFNVIARNELGEKVTASAAISQGQLFIRTHRHLYCIGATKTGK